MSEEQKDYVTVDRGIRGPYSVYMKWSQKGGGFYEPLVTGFTCSSYEESVEEAKAWAEVEGVEFRELKNRVPFERLS